MENNTDDIEEIEGLEDKHILNDAFFLHKTLDRALSSLANGINSGNFNNGMVCKNLEVDQALNIAIAIGIVNKEEYENFLLANIPADDGKDKLIYDTKKSNITLAYIIQCVKKARPMIIKGVI